MFGLSFATLAAKTWFKPVVWLLVILGVALAFMYVLQAYGRSQYQLGRSDKTNEVLQAQATQLTTLIAKVQEWGNDSTKSAGTQAERMASLEAAASGVIAEYKDRVLVIAGADGKCKPTGDMIDAWNKLNTLPAKRK